MRPLEIIFLVTLGIAWWAATFETKRPARLTALLAALAAFGQVGLEDARWSLMPAYGLAAILVVQSLRRRPAPTPPNAWGRRIARTAAATLGLLVLAGSTVLGLLFPVVKLPVPRGPRPVGSTTLQLIDSTRTEDLTDDPADLRRFAVRIWYPAARAGEHPMRYRRASATIGPIQDGGPPDFIFGHLRSIASHSFADAPVAAGPPIPVVVYSTGFTSPLDNGQLLAEDLASQGWIVLSLSHPFESEYQVRPDGRIDRYSPSHAEAFRQHLAVAMPRWARFWPSRDSAERGRLAREILSGEHFMDQAVRTRTADIRAAIDELVRRQAAGDRLAAAMDFSRLAVVGHSLGGATAGQVLLSDARFRAGVNLDGFQFGDAVRDTIRRPLLILSSETFAGANDWLGGRLGSAAVVEVVPGTTHMNFSDDPLVLPVTRRLGLAGPIDPQRAWEIVGDRILSFLNEHVSCPARRTPCE